MSNFWELSALTLSIPITDKILCFCCGPLDSRWTAFRSFAGGRSRAAAISSLCTV